MRESAVAPLPPCQPSSDY